MRSIDHTLITQVGAPIDRVFSVLTDPARIPEWLPMCESIEVEGPIKRGSRLRVRFTDHRMTVFEVVDFQAPSTFGWVEHGGREGAKTFFRLDFAGGATALTVKDVWRPPSLIAWVKARLFPKRNTKRQMDRAVQSLRLAVTK
jgi:uncharacterized protein YndB with AHSA1/START domain